MDNPKSHLIHRVLQFRRNKRIDPKKHFPKDLASFHSEKTNQDTFIKGTEFEAFVVKRFDPDHFTLIELRSDKSIGGIFPLMSKFPDLEFFYNSETNEQFFAVECKWRESFHKEHFQFNKYHIENYKHYESVTGNKTFIVIGIGNQPTQPNHVYILPLSEISDEIFHEFNLEIFKRRDPYNNFHFDPNSRNLR